MRSGKREAKMEKSIIIIGAGLTGLSAGCYGRMNGYRTAIFEMHDKAGGVCTAWKRKGYTIDGAMNWLVGTKPGTNNYKFWEELGATRDWKIYDHDRYIISEDKEGNSYSVYCDADRFEQYLLELSPSDKDAIKEFASALRLLASYDFPADKPPELHDASDRLRMEKMEPCMRLLRKWGAVSSQDFSRRFAHPFLRSLPYFFGQDMVWMLLTLAWQHGKSAGYPIGGALALVESIEARYRRLGGEIRFKSKVVEILVEKDRAVGVRLDDGSEYRADYVISAGDGRSAIFEMLGGKYVDAATKNMYGNPKLFTPLVYVGLGVARSFDDVPPSICGLTYSLDRPIAIAGDAMPYICSRIYNFDPSLSPAGKNVAVVQYGSDYGYWKKLEADPEKYKAEKERIADEVIDRLGLRFPGIADQVEMVDVATPLTWERYTGNWQGSYEGWMFGAFDGNMGKTLPGLDNFFMAGQWVNPGGGMPTAAVSGNHTIQLICDKDRREFITTVE
jgi:phytoene dehydrogenase-like protein